jgi:hypothetical protein
MSVYFFLRKNVQAIADPRNYDYDAEVWEQESRRVKEEEMKAGKK